jgi:hypothetical protein
MIWATISLRSVPMQLFSVFHRAQAGAFRVPGDGPVEGDASLAEQAAIVRMNLYFLSLPSPARSHRPARIPLTNQKDRCCITA